MPDDAISISDVRYKPPPGYRWRLIGSVHGESEGAIPLIADCAVYAKERYQPRRKQRRPHYRVYALVEAQRSGAKATPARSVKRRK